MRSGGEVLLPAPLNARGRPKSATALRPSPWVLVRLVWPGPRAEVRAGRVTQYAGELYCVEWQSHPQAHVRETWVYRGDVVTRMRL